MLNPVDGKSEHQRVFASHARDSEVRCTSSSGGAFSVIATNFLLSGGVVYGVISDANFQVKHVRISSADDIAPLRKSKYVQSIIGSAYRDAKADLENGTPALFSGTPCQIAALYKIVGRKNKTRLITVDLLCHGVPSQKIFDRHIAALQAKDSFKIVQYDFRDCKQWGDYNAVINPRPPIKAASGWNSYMSAYLHSCDLRTCCYHCSYSSTVRLDDISLGDFWGISHYQKDSKHGVSLVLTNCDVGFSLFSNVRDQLYVEERSIDEAVKGNVVLRSAPSSKIDREAFLGDWFSLTPGACQAKYGLGGWTGDVLKLYLPAVAIKVLKQVRNRIHGLTIAMKRRKRG